MIACERGWVIFGGGGRNEKAWPFVVVVMDQNNFALNSIWSEQISRRGIVMSLGKRVNPFGREHLNRCSPSFMNFHRHHCDSFKFNPNVTCSLVVCNAIKMKFNGCADVCDAFGAWLELRSSLTGAGEGESGRRFAQYVTDVVKW